VPYSRRRIADKLLDRASSPLDLRRHRVVEAIEHYPDPFGILIGRKLSRPDEVSEKDRHKLSFLSPHYTILARHPPTRQLITPGRLASHTKKVESQPLA
jgi:hypothetical protein